jgi:hypothetical protein
MSMVAPAIIPLADALADELVLASRMLNDLAYDLGSDEATLRRHMASLQKVDHITQIQLAVADLLRNRDETDTRLAGVTLEGMAERLRAAMG